MAPSRASVDCRGPQHYAQEAALASVLRRQRAQRSHALPGSFAQPQGRGSPWFEPESSGVSPPAPTLGEFVLGCAFSCSGD